MGGGDLRSMIIPCWICNDCWKEVPPEIKEGMLTVFRVPVMDGPNCILCHSYEKIETRIVASTAIPTRWLRDNIK